MRDFGRTFGNNNGFCEGQIAAVGLGRASNQRTHRERQTKLGNECNATVLSVTVTLPDSAVAAVRRLGFVNNETLPVGVCDTSVYVNV